MPGEPAIEAISPQKGAINVTAGSTNTHGNPKVHRLTIGLNTWMKMTKLSKMSNDRSAAKVKNKQYKPFWPGGFP